MIRSRRVCARMTGLSIEEIGMKATTVSSSEIMATGRMDAGFHILRERHKKEAERLKGLMGEKEAIELLSNQKAFPAEALRALAPLAKGSDKERPDSIRKAIEEYPHLALAVLMESAPSILERRAQELREEADTLASAAGKLASMKEETAAPAKKPRR